MNNIKNNLREYRLKAGLRQVDVASLIGLDFADRLSRWENGQAMPNVVNLFHLAAIYKVTPKDLYQDLRRNIDEQAQAAHSDALIRRMSH